MHVRSDIPILTSDSLQCQRCPLQLYFNHIVLQVLPQFILLQLFLLEVLQLYFNVLYLQVLPQFLLCPISACTVVRFNYCFLLNLNCEKSGRLFVKCTGGKCLRRILFEVSHNFHLLVEKFAIVPPTEIVFDQLWEFGLVVVVLCCVLFVVCGVCGVWCLCWCYWLKLIQLVAAVPQYNHTLWEAVSRFQIQVQFMKGNLILLL